MVNVEWWEREDFKYKNGSFYLNGFECEKIAQKFGTPLFVYNGNRFLGNANRVLGSLKRYADREVRVQFMMKANPALGLLGLWNKHGQKFVSVSSPFEAKIALKAGIESKYITWIAGLGASDEVFEQLKKLKVNITIDSLSQLKRIKDLGLKEISVRWNPGIGVGKIPAAGKEADGAPMQFGIPPGKLVEAFEFAKSNGITIKGITQHVGSQVIEKEELSDYFESMGKLIETTKKLEDTGYNLSYICFGGGLSVPYKKSDPIFPLDEMSKYIFEKAKAEKIKTKTIVIEPGRYLTADMGILLTKINLVEEKQGNLFIGIDAGVNLVPRRLFHKKYQTPHQIIACKKREKKIKATICGTLLFTGDNFGTEEISEAKVGDYLAFLNMGAYNPSFEFHFGWPFAREVLAFNGKLYEIRKEETFEDYSCNQFLIEQL